METDFGPNLTAGQVADLAQARIFFGHQSVGDNILGGVRELVASDPRLKITIVDSADPQSVSGPALVESHIGRNGSPQSKNDSFAAIVDKGMGRQGGIAMYKYCYADFDFSTDVQLLFDDYRAGVSRLKQKYPELRFVHITAPLTTVEPAPKAWIKSILGRSTIRDVNAKRNQFNRLLKQAYSETDSIFDLAEVESTRSDGSRSYFTSGNETVYTLAPEYSADGGHLNPAGSRLAARKLLLVLAQASSKVVSQP